MGDEGADLERHALAIASVRALAVRSGAERVVLLLDEGDDAPPTILEWNLDAPLALIEGGVSVAVPDGAAVQTAPVALPDVRPVPASAVEADPELGQIAAPIGAVDSLARAVLALAAGFGGRSVATAEYPTSDRERPMAIAARPGEPIVVAVGDDQFAFPDGWPDHTS